MLFLRGIRLIWRRLGRDSTFYSKAVACILIKTFSFSSASTNLLKLDIQVFSTTKSLTLKDWVARYGIYKDFTWIYVNFVIFCRFQFLTLFSFVLQDKTYRFVFPLNFRIQKTQTGAKSDTKVQTNSRLGGARQQQSNSRRVHRGAARTTNTNSPRSPWTLSGLTGWTAR